MDDLKYVLKMIGHSSQNDYLEGKLFRKYY